MNILFHRAARVVIIFLQLFYATSYSYVVKGVNEYRISTSDSVTLGGRELSTSASESPELSPSMPAERVLTDSNLSGFQTYSLPGVVVTSARIPQTSSFTPSSITILSQADIRSMHGTSLAQIVESQVGLFVKDYGAPSALKTISQRGLGTEHTLVLLNGMRVSSLQNGLVDFGMVPLDDIESVELVRGGQSASYGADAVAGLINVVMGNSKSRSSATALSSIGSFGYRRYQVSGRLSTESEGIRMNYGEERSDGDFSFAFRDGASVANLVRKNSDLFARYLNLSGWVDMNAQTSLRFFGNTYSSSRGVPGAVLNQSGGARARQLDKDHILQALFSSRVAEKTRLAIGAQFHSSYERYEDPGLNIGGSTLDTYFNNRDLRIEPHVDVMVADWLRFSAGSELVHTTAEGKSLVRDVTRTQAGTFIASEVLALRADGVVTNVAVFPSLRHDAIESTAPVWSPQVGALIEFSEFDVGEIRRIQTALRSSVSKNFRIPTFNELYFNGGGGVGNPLLRPERSTSADIGGSARFIYLGEHTAELTYFVNDMNDRIVWSPAGVGGVVPKNLRRVRSSGLEMQYRWELPEKILAVQAAYTTFDTRKNSADYPGDPTVNNQLAYIPQELLTLSANTTVYAGKQVELGGTLIYSFVGFRYYAEDNTDFLPPHRIVNSCLRGRFRSEHLSVSAKLEVDNLFNEEYQVMLGYPMPRRSYRFTLSLEYQ